MKQTISAALLLLTLSLLISYCNNSPEPPDPDEPTDSPATKTVIIDTVKKVTKTD